MFGVVSGIDFPAAFLDEAVGVGGELVVACADVGFPDGDGFDELHIAEVDAGFDEAEAIVVFVLLVADVIADHLHGDGSMCVRGIFAGESAGGLVDEHAVA